jgi:hypothetical protein
MIVEAIRMIRSVGTSERNRKARTSLALNCEATTFCRRSNQSFTRFRKSSTTSRRSTMALRLNSRIMARLDATGRSGAVRP